MVRSRGGASSSTRGAKGRKEVFVKGLPSLGEHFLIQTHNSAESPEIDEPEDSNRVSRKRVRSSAVNEPSVVVQMTQRANPPPPPKVITKPLAKPVRYDFNRDLVFYMDTHWLNYKDFQKRKKVALDSLFPDLPSIGREFNGVLEEAMRKCDKAKMSYLFLGENHGTFSMLAKEFCATFEPIYEKVVGEGPVTDWAFMINGNRFEIPRKLICEWFDFAKKGHDIIKLSTIEMDAFWSKLHGRNELFVCNYTETRIKDPVWKLIHRLVAANVAPRPETGRITAEDLHIMKMIDDGLEIDMVTVMAKVFQKSQSKGVRNLTIYGGSYITHVALKLNILLDAYKPRIVNLDRGKMIEFTMIEGNGEWFSTTTLVKQASESLERRIKNGHKPPTFWPDVPALPLLEYEDGDATNGVDTEASGPSENPTPGSYPSMYYDLSQQMRGISLAQSDLLQRHMDLSDFVHSEADWNRRQWESLNARMDSFFSHYYQQFPGSSSTFPDPDPSVDDS